MSTMTMDMSSFAVESDSLVTVEYGDEVLNAGWNPVLALQQNFASEHMAMPLSLASVDVVAFLKRMYASQR
jgi:hypothetical protein